MVDQITATQPTPPAPSASGATASDKAALSSDFETFLRMLTVQVQNQDPLNPVDSTDYATQLATFSSVEQQVLTNDLLRAMSTALGGDALQETSGWIGMEALARAPVWFDRQTPIAMRPEYAPGAESATLVVRDADGAVIQRIAVTPGQDALLWGGGDDNGEVLPAGVYRFEIESYDSDGLIDTRAAPTYNRITEVRREGDDVLVRLSDGTELPKSLVTGLRAPG